MFYISANLQTLKFWNSEENPFSAKGFRLFTFSNIN